MSRYALISNDVVQNVTEWDGEADWSPPEGISAVACADSVGPGWAYDGSTFTAPNTGDPKAAKKAVIDDAYNTWRLAGFSWNFGSTEAPNVQVLQIRDADDQANWLTLARTCDKMIAAGAGSETVPLPIRTESNQTQTPTATAADAIMDAMAAWGAAGMARSWALKDAVDAAADQAGIDAVPIDGWPVSPPV